ncbi:response regulator transcription factor [Lapidilactobacillus luobeiensis]|uniref:response regulator transcription factor n=1 Tax=Lapidilactobacillus luobeiensis TaxID=2950371 RepID=UPI0021C2C1CA|nr:response regulator transcription factor [Lapidilactobacillus luobeiensis]
MNIFILEDDVWQRQKFVDQVYEITQRRKFEVDQVIATGQPDELLTRLTQVGQQQIYFLDIEIKNSAKCGLEVAQSIRQRDAFGTIIFVTTHSEFAPLTYQYKVAALDFIAKDQPESGFVEQLEESLAYVATRSNETDPQDYFNFESTNKSVHLPFAELMYFETSPQPHKIVLITANQRIEFYGHMADIDLSDHRLMLVHRSFIVNMANVTLYNKKTLTLTVRNGDDCPVSRRRSGKVDRWLRAQEKDQQNLFQ